MNFRFDPFTPEQFLSETGMHAIDNEAVYLRWVNTQINYASYRQLQSMYDTLKQLKRTIDQPLGQFARRHGQ